MNEPSETGGSYVSSQGRMRGNELHRAFGNNQAICTVQRVLIDTVVPQRRDRYSSGYQKTRWSDRLRKVSACPGVATTHAGYRIWR